jgi:sugar lactone lactonase YvrE
VYLLLVVLISFSIAAFPQTNDPCQVQMIAGPPSTWGGDGGPANAAYLLAPRSVSVDAQGNVYIADTQNHRIRIVRGDGTIATFAGAGVAGNSGDGGNAAAAQFSTPQGVLAAADGSVYVSDTGNSRVRRISSDGTIQAFAGAHSGFSGDNGPAQLAELSEPVGLAEGPDGSIYIADTANNRIRRVDPGGQITTVAGTQNGVGRGVSCLPGSAACYSGDGGLAANARLNLPRGLAVGPDGTLYIADTANQVVRKVDPSGTISTIVGATFDTSGRVYPQPAMKAYIGRPDNVATLSDGSLLISSSDLIRLGTDGIVNTYRGGAFNGLAGDGSPNLAVTVGKDAVAYFSDSENNVVMSAAQSGASWQVVAGQLYYGTGTEGGPATAPGLNSPQGMAIASDGTVYVADTFNHRIRKISPGGIIRTIAGTGVQGFSGDGGPAVSARLAFPDGVAVDASGTVYIADTQNRAIRKVTPDGIINTLASGSHGGIPFDLDGYPRNLVADANGNLYTWMESINSAPPFVTKISTTTATLLFSFNQLSPIDQPYVGLALDASGNWCSAS